MSPAEALAVLNNEAKRWRLSVGRDANVADGVCFWASGAVLPPGRKRGERMFYGGAYGDAQAALVSGAEAMRVQRESPA